MSGIDQYLTLLQNGAYASFAAAIISGVNLLILVRLLSRVGSRRDWLEFIAGNPALDLDP